MLNKPKPPVAIQASTPDEMLEFMVQEVHRFGEPRVIQMACSPRQPGRFISLLTLNSGDLVGLKEHVAGNLNDKTIIAFLAIPPEFKCAKWAELGPETDCYDCRFSDIKLPSAK